MKFFLAIRNSPNMLINVYIVFKSQSPVEPSNKNPCRASPLSRWPSSTGCNRVLHGT